MRILNTCLTSAGLVAVIGALPVLADVNETTSRYLRTEYMCRVATEDGLKPVPAGLDHFRMTSSHYGVADLYGDGTIDFFFGFSDETRSLDMMRRQNETRETPWPLEMYFDNAARSYQNHQYSFYSPDPDFVVPDNTRFLLARTIAVQDYNGDGIDDFAVAQYGRDYRPAEPRQNELFLSGPDGYAFSVLPGGAGKNHGASAGDIDGDGDVDLVISRGRTNDLRFFENDGQGRFALRQARGIPRYSAEIRSTTVGLWDIDEDGHLDLVTSRRSDPFDGGIATVFWGRDGFAFEAEPTIIFVDGLEDSGVTYMRDGLPMPTAPGVLDLEFADFDGDGSTDIALVSQSDFYQRWQISVAEFNGRTTTARIVDRSANDSSLSLFWISACDLREDGTMDLVYESFNQNLNGIWRRTAYANTSRMERYVWLNDGMGAFTRYLLESPIYFPPGYAPYLAANADWLGVASESYLPAQTYFPNVLDDRERYLHPFYELDVPHRDMPFVMVPEIADQFPNLRLMSPDGSVARQHDASQISPRAAAIIEAMRAERERQAAVQLASPDAPESTQEPETTAQTPPPAPNVATPRRTAPIRQSTEVSPRAQAVLDAIRRGEDPHAALADAPIRSAPGVNRPSVARTNDPAEVSDRVRAIIEGGRDN